MSEWERVALTKCPLLPILYLRYLDDIFGIWTHTIPQFMEFINILNSHHSSIKLKHTIDKKERNFLDTTIFLNTTQATHNSLQTKVYFKPTDTHALLLKSSHHPKHTFKAIIKSQLIQFHGICSNVTDFHNATSTLFHSLRLRGYSKRLLRTIKNTTLSSLAATLSEHPPTPPPRHSISDPSPTPSPRFNFTSSPTPQTPNPTYCPNPSPIPNPPSYPYHNPNLPPNPYPNPTPNP